MRTDKKLLDFLELMHLKNQYSDTVVLRQSGTGRGWRLHTSLDHPEDARLTVRDAINDYIDSGLGQEMQE